MKWQEKLRCPVPLARAYLRLIQRVNPNRSGVPIFFWETSYASEMGQCASATQLPSPNTAFEAQVLRGGSFWASLKLRQELGNQQVLEWTALWDSWGVIYKASVVQVKQPKLSTRTGVGERKNGTLSWSKKECFSLVSINRH